MKIHTSSTPRNNIFVDNLDISLAKVESALPDNIVDMVNSFFVVASDQLIDWHFLRLSRVAWKRIWNYFNLKMKNQRLFFKYLVSIAQIPSIFSTQLTSYNIRMLNIYTLHSKKIDWIPMVHPVALFLLLWNHAWQKWHVPNVWERKARITTHSKQ